MFTTTAAYRGVDVVALSIVVGDLAVLRSKTYDAYRFGLGPDGQRLPADFLTVVEIVIAFADGLAGEAPSTTNWDPSARRWVG